MSVEFFTVFVNCFHSVNEFFYLFDERKKTAKTELVSQRCFDSQGNWVTISLKEKKRCYKQGKEQWLICFLLTTKSYEHRHFLLPTKFINVIRFSQCSLITEIRRIDYQQRWKTIGFYHAFQLLITEKLITTTMVPILKRK